VGLAAAACVVLFPGAPEPPPPAPAASAAVPSPSEAPGEARGGLRRERNWRPESLGELEFDEVLTLLGGEVERCAARSPAAAPPGEDLERAMAPILSRIEALHRGNLAAIARAREVYSRLSSPARERLREVEREYERRCRTLHALIDEVRGGRSGAAATLVSFLRETGAWRPPPAAPEPHESPLRRVDGGRRLPRLAPEEWKAGGGERSARARGREPPPRRNVLGELLGGRVALAQGIEGEGGGDLDETPEVLFDPARAPELNRVLDQEGLRGSPARIAAWVRDSIELVPVWGALQSSETCVRTRRGTAMDIASTLIAMLRASGIEARYAAGTVRMPIEDAMEWLGGFTDAGAAASLLASGGTPAVVQVDGAGTPVALRFEHVWVKAHVDWVPSRGACHEAGDAWLDIDASVKRRAASDAPDVRAFLDDVQSPEFDFDSFNARVQALVDTAITDPVTGGKRGLDVAGLDAFLEARAGEAFDALLQSGLSVLALSGRDPIRASASASLAAVPPFETLARGWERSELAAAERAGARIRLARGERDLLVHSLPAPGAPARLSLAFRPESSLDAEIISGQIPAGPGASSLFDRLVVAGVRAIPELRRAGATVASGAPVALGEPLELDVELTLPGLKLEPVRIHLAAGQVTALALDLAGVEPAFEDLEQGLAALEAAVDAGDASIGGVEALDLILSSVALGWFRTLDRVGEVGASAMGCALHRLPSAGAASSPLRAESLFGLPFALRQGKLNVDVPGDRGILVARDGSEARARAAILVRGFLASSLESLIPTELFHAESAPEHWLATANALRLAVQNGDLLVLIGPENLEAALSPAGLSLPPGDEEQIREAVGRGFWVLAHATPFQSLGGVHAGYAVIDPGTGSGSYRVSSGTDGADGVACKKCGPERPCCNSPGGCTGPLDRFTRLWASAFHSTLFDTFLGELKDVANPVKQVTSVIEAYNANDDMFDAALASVPEQERESLRPLVGMVVLMTFLQAVNEIFCPDEFESACDKYLGVVQGTAWRGVANVIKYRVRTDAAIEGVDMPPNCLEQLIRSGG
jgi:hypothetical protein